jgi:DNA-binding MarR family transcriptional regulator
MAERTSDTEAEAALALAVELRVVLGQLVRRLREQTSAGDLTRSQESVLARLERDGPATSTDLARAEGVRPQSMSSIVTALEDAGLISGTPDPTDGRKTVISLSDAAREHYATGRLAKQDWLFRAIRTNLAPAEQERLSASVDLLHRLAGS